MKQYQVAAAASITRPMLSAYETGRQKPTLKTLNRILEALDCELKDLFEALQLVAGRRGEPPAPEVPRAVELLDVEAEDSPEELRRLLGILDGSRGANTREEAAFSHLGLAFLRWLCALREEARRDSYPDPVIPVDGCSG